MSSIYQYKQGLAFELKDVDIKSRITIGAFTRYNVKDADGDIGRKGMFKKTWGENGPTSDRPRIKHLLNHDITQPIGKPLELWDDDDYAYYKSLIGTHTLGDDYLKMAESGLITEHSYGFTRIRDNKTKEGNEMLEVKQWEFSSLTSWGANEFSPLLSVAKGQNKDALLEKLLKRTSAVEKFCRNSTATDETIQFMLIEYKQLQQILIDLSNTSTVPEEKSTQPDSAKELIDIQTELKSTIAGLFN